MLADSPEFFVARGNTTGDIVLFALALVLVPPTLMVLVELALSRWPRVRDLVHLAFVAALVIALLIEVFKSVSAGPGIPLTALALAGGVAAALLYARTEAAGAVLTVLSPAPAVFVIWFLLFSPVHDLFKSDAVPVRHDVRASAPVVVVVFDEFSIETLMTPDGKIDASRYPNFAALAHAATWYRNATTVSDHTTDAVPAILTGRYPEQGSLPTASSHPHNLFTLLGGAYTLDNVTEPATDLCPSQLCGHGPRPALVSRLKSLGKDLTIVQLHKVLPQRLAAHLPAVTQGFGNFAGQGRDKGAASAIPGLAFENRAAQFGSFLDRIDPARPRRLNFIHVLLPHTSYQYLPNGQDYPPIEGKDIPGLDDVGIWTKDPVLPAQSLQRNLAQVGFVDRLIGRLMSRMRAEGTWDRALLVVTADHGISFRPGASRRTAAPPGAVDVLGMPLFVKLPGQRGGKVDDRHATTADVLPTIADALHLDLKWRVDGRSLHGPPRPASDPVVVSVFPSRRRVSMPFADYVRGRNSELRYMRFAEGPRGGWAGVYAAGAHSDLFGRPVAELPTGPPSGLHASLDHADRFESVDPHADTIPAFVEGAIEGGGSERANVAIAVNGVVQGVVRTYASDDGRRFGGLVPPSAFRSGANDVRLYSVSDEGALSAIGTSAD